ncbi:MAG: NFACT family protein [Clostridia bacterium]|nr:NFACT family protein [Clostridia bacterium]
MPQDAFHIRRLSQELDRFLRGGKINRISQVDKDELTFIIYTGKSTVKLILSTNASNARVCLSEREKEPLAVPPNFCMLLRKHLQGAEILSVVQKDFERIIELTLKCTSDFSECERVLHCELMGKYSNIVLSEKGIVLGALKTTALLDDSHRVLLAGAKYAYPLPQDKISPFDGAGMRALEQSFYETHAEGYENEAFAKFIFEHVSGLALPTAREIVARAAKVKMPLWAFIGEFCENAPNEPHLKTENGEPVDFFAFEIAGGKAMPSLCKAEDEYYSFRENKKGFADKKRKLESAARTLRKKAAKRLQEITERLAESEKAEENRVKGELLTANLYRLEKGAKSATLENWYDEQGGEIKIALEPLLTPAQNAQKYFKAYNKQKRAKEILLPMQRAEQRELSYAESILSAINAADAEQDFKEIEEELVSTGALRAPKARIGGKKKETPVPFREYEHDGKKILLGRNNLQNDKLLRQAAPDDIWLHTQKYHSSHAIICAQGGQVSDETVLYAAELCAYYSDGRDGDKIPVDYCKRKYVKKPSKSKAGFVVYTDYKTILVTPKKG